MERPGIPTPYKGYLFRSRLEARWAVFFDALHMAYRYEPEGYELANSLRYLPDFWLPGLQMWVEIKPARDTYDDMACKKADGLAKLTGYPVAVLVGDVWAPDTGAYVRPGDDAFDAHYIHFGDGWDNYHFWCQCANCGMVGFEFSGFANRIHCPCHPVGIDKPRYTAERSDLLMAAYGAARSARFERTHP